MNKYVLMAIFSLLLSSYPFDTWASKDNSVCTDIGGVMYGKQTGCQKGDIIMVNPMMAAFLCDMSLPIISGDKTIVCHYLGKKRSDRTPRK